jgi:hypothetical protein
MNHFHFTRRGKFQSPYKAPCRPQLFYPQLVYPLPLPSSIPTFRHRSGGVALPRSTAWLMPGFSVQPDRAANRHLALSCLKRRVRLMPSHVIGCPLINATMPKHCRATAASMVELLLVPRFLHFTIAVRIFVFPVMQRLFLSSCSAIPQCPIAYTKIFSQ